MIKQKGQIKVIDGSAGVTPILQAVDKLKDGEYNFLIYDDNKNRALPELKYLFGVVLKTISENLPNNPPVEGLYKYFENIYAPLNVVEIDGVEFEYCDLKNEKTSDMVTVTDRIIEHAQSEWGIKVHSRDQVKEAGAKELYVGAYTEDWKDLFKLSESN